MDRQPPVAAVNRAVPYLVPFLVILAVSLLVHAASADFEWLYPLRFVAATGTLWFLRHRYVAPNAAFDWRLTWTGPVLGIAVFVLWVALEMALHPAASTAMPVVLATASAPTRIAWISIRALAAVTTVPIAEELAFRGFLLRRVIAEDFETVAVGRFTWQALLISSIAFGALHGSRWIAGTLAGLLFAYAAMRRGKLGDAIVAHATANAVLAAYVLISGHWQLW